MLVSLTVSQSAEGGNGKLPSGIAEEFARLYEKFLPKIFQYVSYRLGDKETAQDITSQVFEKAITKYDTYDERKASFATWIYTIAYHTVVDYYRTRDRELNYIRNRLTDTQGSCSSPEEEATRSEAIDKLRSCLTRLKDNEREIITMKFSGGMSNREIAKILNLSETNVGVILCRAIRKLRDDFTGW